MKPYVLVELDRGSVTAALDKSRVWSRSWTLPSAGDTPALSRKRGIPIAGAIMNTDSSVSPLIKSGSVIPEYKLIVFGEFSLGHGAPQRRNAFNSMMSSISAPEPGIPVRLFGVVVSFVGVGETTFKRPVSVLGLMLKSPAC